MVFLGEGGSFLSARYPCIERMTSDYILKAAITWFIRGLNQSTASRGTRNLWYGGHKEVSRGEKMLDSGTDPDSYITVYTLAYEE